MKQECGVFIVTIKKHVTPLYSCLKVLWYELIAFVLCECFVKVTVRCLRGELSNTPGAGLVGVSVSTCLEGPCFHGELKSHGPR